MILNAENIELAFKGFKTRYNTAYLNAPAQYDKIAQIVPSAARDETYGWLGQFPQLREWTDGDRIVKDLTAHSFTITNRKFESTVGVKLTVMVVPPSLEAAALDILNSALTETGGTNKWAGTAELIVTPYIAE